MATKLLTGVEVFAEGTWNGRTFSADDLDMIASSFETLGLTNRVPLKLGHDGPDARESPLDQLALGWVTRVYRAGAKLLADMEVPAAVFTLIEDGLLRHVSVELLQNVQAGTRIIPWVLDAVALLGTDQPAVGILKDLKQARKTAVARLSHSGRFAHSVGAERVTFAKVTDSGSDLVEQLRAANERIAQLTATAVVAHRASITSRIESAINAGECAPNIRVLFARQHDLEDDEAVLTVSLRDVEDFISAHRAPRNFSRSPQSLGLPSGIPSGTSPGDEMTVRAEAWLKERGILEPTGHDFQRAVVAVFRADPSAGERYKADVLSKTGVRR